MPRTFHPCTFQFRTTNIQRVGHATDGGPALDGSSTEIESSGGGFLTADFTEGSTRDKRTGNAWRAVTDLDAGETMVVLLCAERLFQPVGGLARVSHSDGTPFDDGGLYESGELSITAAADAALRDTTLTLVGAADLIGGELFSIEHPNWGWRAYRVRSVDGATIQFRPPLREAIDAGTWLEFDTPRCQMKLAQKPNNQTSQGRYTACAISFVEDMTPPEMAP